MLGLEDVTGERVKLMEKNNAELEEENVRLKVQHNKALDDFKAEMASHIAEAKATTVNEGIEEGACRFIYST